MPRLPVAVREWWRKFRNLMTPDGSHPNPMEVYRALLREGERGVMVVLDRAIAPNRFVCHIIWSAPTISAILKSCRNQSNSQRR